MSIPVSQFIPPASETYLNILFHVIFFFLSRQSPYCGIVQGPDGCVCSASYWALLTPPLQKQCTYSCCFIADGWCRSLASPSTPLICESRAPFCCLGVRCKINTSLVPLPSWRADSNCSAASGWRWKLSFHWNPLT